MCDSRLANVSSRQLDALAIALAALITISLLAGAWMIARTTAIGRTDKPTAISGERIPNVAGSARVP